MHASKRATARSQTQLIVHGPLTLSLTALAVRRVFQTCQVPAERRAKIPYRTAQSLVTALLTAVTNASSHVIKANADLVWRQLLSRVDADVTPSPPSVIKELKKHHSVCAFAVSHLTAVDTNVENTAVPENAKLPSDKQIEGSHAH